MRGRPQGDGATNGRERESPSAGCAVPDTGPPLSGFAAQTALDPAPVRQKELAGFFGLKSCVKGVDGFHDE